MQSVSPDNHPKSSDAPLWSGSVLRTIRSDLGLSTQDLSQATRIRRGLIESIESDDFDQLPSPAYTRGLLFQIAKALKLPAEEVAHSYTERMKSA